MRPNSVPCVKASYEVNPVSVPQTMEPLASVSSAAEQLAMVGIFTPPVKAVTPAKVLVAEAPIAVVWMPPEKVEVAVEVAE